MKQNYSLKKTFNVAKIFLLCALSFNAAFGQVNNTTSKSEKSSLNHPAATAQDMNLRQAEMSRTAKNADVSPTEQTSLNPELRELNLNANLLLNELRQLLKNTEKEMIFRESVGPGIIDKSNVLCPSVELKNLLLGDDRSKSVLIHDKAELKTFMNLITEAINFLEN